MEKVQLLAKDFKGTDYIGIKEGCAIAKALMRMTGLPLENVKEYVDRLRINDEEFHHAWYAGKDFTEDWTKAEAAGFDDTVIREIELWKR